MSDEKQTHEHIQFNTKINVYAPIIFVFGSVFSLFALFVMAVFVVSHWSTFVSITVGIAYSLLVIFALVAIGGLFYFALILWEKWNKVRASRMRSRVLHTDQHYAIVDMLGQAEVIPVLTGKSIYSVREDKSVIADMPTVKSLPYPVLSFHDLLVNGTIQKAIRKGEMLLGNYAESKQPRYGSWLELYSCSVGGVSGSGKTTTVRFLLFQAILSGARLLMIDPHIHDAEQSLAAQFQMFTHSHVMQPCDGNTNAILKRVRWMSKELARRKQAGSNTPFLVFVVDEFNEVMRDATVREELSTLLLDIAQGGRKFGIFAMLIGQRWSSQDIGGADIRSSLASSLAHRFTDEDQAKKLLGTRNGAKCLDLETGHYLFRDTDGKLCEMITPECTFEDGKIIQRMLENTRENTTKIHENTEEKTSGVIVLDPENTRENTEETTKIQEKARLVVTLQAQGKQKPDIMRQVWNVNPGSSAAYENATQEYLQVMQYIATRI